MEKTVEQLADDCIKWLHQCRLEAKDEKASAALHNRLADFNLWCDGVGARAGSRASLEKRFQSRPDDLAMIKGMLTLLRQFLENYAQLLRERQDTSAALRNVDSALENLALLAMAIRQTGTRSRLEKADRKYDPSDHVHFRDHMEFMLRIQGSPVGLKSTCLGWRQHRLLEANLRRRNRFVQAQRHSEHLKSRHANRQEASIHQYPSEKSSNTMEVELTSQLATSSQPISPTIQFPRLQSANVLENTVSWASASAPDSKEKLDFRDARRYSSASEGPRTVITNITASTDYPHVKVPLDQQSFQCPCCCQVLIRDYAVDDSLWR
ncbi:hypothetical protein K4F52_002292 [Lecanicillium sp. MT-2017a]|nr:hypothetical protein K4F52_002292 [Lecanicillium sp. MT-2017a]